MVKTLRDWIRWAEQNKFALGHFNISDTEGLKAVVEASKELSLPVIIGVSEGERNFIGIEEVVALVKVEKEKGFPIFLNADHTYSLEGAKKAIDASFDAVIADGAKLSFEENVRFTKECVNYAKSKGRTLNSDSQGSTLGILVEGELGFIGQSSTILENLPEGVSETTQTKPEDAKKFVEETRVDLFAPSVGNVHGMIKTGNPRLNIALIKEIREAVGIPLVLHGGSGISDEDIKQAIDAGISIIHINTELRLAYKEGIEEGLKSDEVAPYKFLAKGVEEMKEVVIEKLKLFNKISLG